jgi:competence protein ComEC
VEAARGRWPALLLGLAVASVVALALANSAEIRDRAEAALARGMPPREAALARGFVLGQDEGIDPDTVEDFRRSGLSHLLAVSGQNVALLALLAMPLLAALGLPLRARLVWILGLIVVYVALAGAGPSIQRAGTMGALSVVATLSGRRASRLYALLVAAIVTLTIEPRIAADVGWQLSFAAVVGILLFAGPLRRLLMAWIGGGGGRRALAEAVAVTVSATLATAPLIAHHFGEISTTTLLANLLVLPAVAPAMWLGMLTAMASQVPGFPVEPFNSLNAVLLAYIAQIASWCGRPSWAQLEARLGTAGLIASYLAILGAAGLGARLIRRRRVARRRRPPAGAAGESETPAISRLRALRRRMPWATATAIALVVGTLAWTGADGGADADAAPSGGLRISVLDVGQGDAILLQPAGRDAVLVDGGPPGSDIAAQLRAAGVEKLGAAIVSHDQSDHAGGIHELLGEMPIGALLYAAAARRTLVAAHAAGAVPRRLVAGGALRSGSLRLEALWPPPELLHGSHRGEDPNRLSLVLLLRWRRFSMLMPGDAEAEAVPLDPGPIDVLKVAHHGSEDAGLDDLLDRTVPRVAVVSVGGGNSFGHPTATTMATLAAHRVRRFRTDRDGTVVLDVGRRSFRVIAGR